MSIQTVTLSDEQLWALGFWFGHPTKVEVKAAYPHSEGEHIVVEVEKPEEVVLYLNRETLAVSEKPA